MLPMALWRYSLTFLELREQELLALSCVSTTWRQWIQGSTMITGCMICVSKHMKQSHVVFDWLRMVKRITISSSEYGHLDLDVHLVAMSQLQDLTVLNGDGGLRLTGYGLHGLTAMTRLDLNHCNRLRTNMALMNMHRLKALHLVNCRNLGSIDTVFGHLSSLEELVIHGDSRFDNFTLTSAAFPYFTSLHTLRLSAQLSGPFAPQAFRIDDSCFAYLSRLTKLSLYSCVRIGDAALVHLGNLMSLSISRNCSTSLTRVGCQYLTSLRTLKLVGKGCCTEDAFAPLTSLVSLTLRLASIQSWDGSRLLPVPQLQSLSIYGDAHYLTDAVMQRLRHLTHLQVFGGDCRRGCRLSDMAFKNWDRLLEFQSIDFLWGAETALSDAAFTHLTSLTMLHLRDRCAAFTGAAFSHLTALKVLRCDRNKVVTDDWMHPLTRLEVLNIQGCTQAAITDGAFTHLPLLTRLCMDRCSQASITPAIATLLHHVDIVSWAHCSREVELALWTCRADPKHKDF